MATERDMCMRTVHLLFEPAATAIDFTFDGVHVSGKEFIGVATMLLMKLNGFAGIGFTTDMPSQYKAGYNQRLKVIGVRTFDYGVTPEERESLLHECCHAWRDLTKPMMVAAGPVPVPMPLTRLANEILGYIAGALFTAHDTTQPGEAPKAPDWAHPYMPERPAFEIARSIWTKPGAVVSADDAADLRAKILGLPAYENLAADPGLLLPD